jgi:Gpi18-like mannosyltransferase
MIAMFRSWKPFAPALATAVASRALVLLAGRFASLHLPPDPTSPANNAAAPMWFRWDAVAYLEIARSGYSSEFLTAFFPLYPLLGGALSWLTGLPPHWTLLVIANACFLAMALVLFDVTRRELGERAALLAVASVSFLPPTVFLSAGYTESLFMLLSILSLRALRGDQPWPAAALAALASASRPLGWALAVPIALATLRASAGTSLQRWRRAAVLSVVSVSGLLLYMAFLALVFGDALLFLRQHARWHAGFAGGLAAYLPWRLAEQALAMNSREAAVNGVFFAGAVICVLLTARTLPARYTLFTVTALLVLYWRAPYITLQGVHRHVFSLVTLHMSTATLLDRCGTYALPIVAFTAGLSVFWTALYVQGYILR